MMGRVVRVGSVIFFLVNECPFCLTAFASKATAVQHFIGAYKRGYCKPQLSKFKYDVKEIEEYNGEHGVPFDYNTCYKRLEWKSTREQ